MRAKNNAKRSEEMDRLISESIQNLSERDKREVFHFIEFLKLKEDRSFIKYVNSRTTEAIDAKERGEHFTSLQELQKEYA